MYGLYKDLHKSPPTKSSPSEKESYFIDPMNEVFFKKQIIQNTVAPPKITKFNFIEKTLDLMGSDILDKKRLEHPQQPQQEGGVSYPTAVNEAWGGKGFAAMQAVYYGLTGQHISKLYEDHMDYLAANAYQFAAMSSLTVDDKPKKKCHLYSI